MILNKDQFPVVVQAYEITDNKEFFVAEQVVASQSEVDVFVNRYAGKLIKARALTSTERNTSHTNSVPTTTHRRSSAGTIVLIILIILAILIAVGFYTGWIQTNFGIGA